MTSQGEIYRGHEITREKIDGQIRWVVTKDGTIVHVTANGEDAAMGWVDAERRKLLAAKVA